MATQKPAKSLTAKNPPPSPTKNQANSQVAKSFEGHLRELYNRIVIVVLVFLAACIAGYVLREQLQTILLQPLNNQTLVYTSPAGGLNFVIKICLLFGFLISLPLLIYQVLAFVKPAHRVISQKLVIITFFISSMLAFCGVIFAYYVILPASLNFLTDRQLADRRRQEVPFGENLSKIRAHYRPQTGALHQAAR